MPTVDKIKVNTQLYTGTKDGVRQHSNQSIGTLNPTRYDDDKAMNIIDAMKPILSKDVDAVSKTVTSTM